MFADALELTLNLTIKGKTFNILGGNVKSFTIDLHSYGFTSHFTFWVSDEKEKDTLFALFTKQDLIEVLLEVAPHFKPKNKQLEPIKLQGLVTQKNILTERTIESIHIKGHPVLYRYYEIAFADPAYVLWRQHFPCDLMVDKSVKDLLNAHKGSVELKYDWDVLDDKFAIIALPLGIEKNTASFYDFVFWYVASLNGVLSYDCNANSYTLSKNKSADGKPIPLRKAELHDYTIAFPETVRHTVNLLNAYSKDPKHKQITQSQSVDGVHHDCLVRFPIASDFEKRSAVETQKLKIREHELHVTFCRFPLMTYNTGCLIKFEKNTWSAEVFPYNKVYRVRDIFLKANSVERELTADHNMPYARYNIDMTSHLELKSEEWVSLPKFIPPEFPLYVEGVVVSEQGKDEDITYQIYQDSKTSLDQYKVTIPLWENQKIVVPFEPNFFTGHFYFPIYKGARVLVALEFQSGRIERFLDWRDGARLPMDTQGNRMLMGKTAKSQTFINHDYVDQKPIFKVKRTSDNDTQRITLEEGSLILETKEE